MPRTARIVIDDVKGDVVQNYQLICLLTFC